MDANGTRHHLLLGHADWIRCGWAGVAWDAERAEMTLKPRLFQFVAPPGAQPPDLRSRRGAARDRYGNWYWIAASQREILVNSAGDFRTSHYWSSADPSMPSPLSARGGDFQPLPGPAASPLALSGLAITEDHYLVVGVTDPPGLLVFDLYATGGPRQIGWSADVPFAPFDMAPRARGGVWILDRQGRCYWELDRQLNVVARKPAESAPARRPDFEPVVPLESDAEPVPLPRHAVPVAASDPIAIDALPDGSVLILDGTLIWRYRDGHQLGEPVSTDVILELLDATTAATSDVHVIGYDFAFESQASRLYIVSSTGDQAFAFTVTYDADQLIITALPQYLPMRLFEGKGVVVADGRPYYDFADRWIPLVEQRRPRFVVDATLDTPVFDGRDPDCVWHRLLLDGCIPDGTEVAVSTRADNDAADVSRADWQLEPRPYLRGDGSELPFVREPRGEGLGTWELLIQQARGRFFQARLHLRGDGRSTPRLRALRAYYPRFSYLDRYLPAVYREDAGSASFVDRFLANVEGFYTAIEDKIGSVQVLFDVRSSPPDVLDWLIGWFGALSDPAWDERRKRLFIAHALELFQYRGTARGIQMGLQLVFGSWTDASIYSDAAYRCESHTGIRIIEQFRTRTASPVALGDPGGGSGEANEPAQDDPQIQQAWRDFLARRYRRVSALNRAYGTNLSGFDRAQLPTLASLSGNQAADWAQFQSVVTAMRRRAHRFTVVMPISPKQRGTADDHRQWRDLATRIVNLEKPAQTVFDVKFYWALFRVGAVRLELDTLLDLGSRAPELLPPLVLQQGYLSEGYLAAAFPQAAAERTILGRDPLTASAHSRPGGR